MARSVAHAIMQIAPDVDVFGSIDYEGDLVTWPPIAYQSRPGSAYGGFVVDLSGKYFMHGVQYSWQNSSTAEWTLTTGVDTQGVDAEYQTAGTFTQNLHQTASSGLFLAIFTNPNRERQWCRGTEVAIQSDII